MAFRPIGLPRTFVAWPAVPRQIHANGGIGLSRSPQRRQTIASDTDISGVASVTGQRPNGVEARCLDSGLSRGCFKSRGPLTGAEERQMSPFHGWERARLSSWHCPPPAQLCGPRFRPKQIPSLAPGKISFVRIGGHGQFCLAIMAGVLLGRLYSAILLSHICFLEVPKMANLLNLWKSAVPSDGWYPIRALARLEINWMFEKIRDDNRKLNI